MASSDTESVLEKNDLPEICRSRPATALALVSVLGLFLELMLIRWVGAEIRLFAYLQNIVLIVCFLGLGMGCFSCRRPIVLRETLWPLAALVVLFSIPLTREQLGTTVSESFAMFGDIVIWNQSANWSENRAHLWRVLPFGILFAFCVIVLIWEAFVPIGRLIGRLFDEDRRPIRAYSVNVAGSLVGIWLFVALGILETPPVVWVAITAALVAPFLGWPSRTNWFDYILLAVIMAFAWPGGLPANAIDMRWSPYQKLALLRWNDPSLSVVRSMLTVNNSNYQAVMDLRLANPSPNARPDFQDFSQYDVPFFFKPNAGSALIVGSGTGNDVAGALRSGVESITAVEIDPVIVELGKKYHPEQPYSSPKVHVVVDDARSYFAKSKERFDIVSFGFLDSHTAPTLTNALLDHYVYTKQSLQHARTLLKEDGVFALAFFAERPYVADRMAHVLEQTFGSRPIGFRVPTSKSGANKGVMFIAGNNDAIAKILEKNPLLADHVRQWQAAAPLELTYTTKVATDDWPYIYLRTPGIQAVNLLMAALMILLVFYCQIRLKESLLTRGWTRSHWHFFFLGAAFLLLEVQNISKASVVFGSTWQVNAVVISGVLGTILLANAVAAVFPRFPLPLAYTGQIGACALLYWVDMSRFAFLPLAAKILTVGALATLPMFFSGIIFVRSFAAAPAKNQALGANLIGSLVGGMLQPITYLTGIKALLIVVAGFYLMAMATQQRAATNE